MKKINILLVLLVLLSGCASKETVYYDGSASQSVGYEMASESITNDASADYAYSNEETKIIKSASLSIETKQFDDALNNIHALTESAGGWIENESIYNNTYTEYDQRYGYLTLRIPEDKLNDFLNGTDEIGNVTSKSLSQSDVTDDYYDVQGYLDSYKAEKERLEALYEKAETMSDILEIESKLTEVNHEIDYYSGTLKQYDSKINYSTVEISLDEVIDYTIQNQSFLERLGNSFIEGLSDFGIFMENAILFIAGNVIWFIIIGIIIFFGMKRKQKKGYLIFKPKQK